MRRWTTLSAFVVVTAVVVGCTSGGGAATGSASAPSAVAPSSDVPASAPASGATSEACNPPRQEGVTLTFVSFGGAYQEAQRKAWLEPYTQLTGVQFQEDEASSNATIKTQVESGQVTWDVVDVGNDFGLEANSALLEELDYSLDPARTVNKELGSEQVARARHHLRRRPRLQHREDGRPGAGGMGRLLRYSEVSRQAGHVGLLGGRDLRGRAPGRRCQAD